MILMQATFAPSSDGPGLPLTIPSLATSMVNRREFLGRAATWAGGCAVCLHGAGLEASSPPSAGLGLVESGCSAVQSPDRQALPRQAGGALADTQDGPGGGTRTLRNRFATARAHFADVDFVVNELVTEKSQVAKLKETLEDVDGVLAIHLAMGVKDIIEEILACKRPLPFRRAVLGP